MGVSDARTNRRPQTRRHERCEIMCVWQRDRTRSLQSRKTELGYYKGLRSRQGTGNK